MSMPTRSLRAVIYLRVSTERQARNGGDEGYSIPAQREACLRKAEALGADVVDEYADRGESARSADRASLQDMLTRIETKEDVHYVIVHKVDRLARNRRDDVEIGFRLRNAGAQLVSCVENIDDTPSGALLHSIMSGIAEFYSRNLAHEVKKGLHQKAKSGGTPTQAPIGYLNARAKIDGREIKTVDLDDERSPHIRWAFETFAGGDWSLSEIAEELEARGLRRRPTVRYAATPLSRSQVHRMLRNPYYVGIVRYAGVDYVGKHEPLVDLATWQQTQTVMEAHRVASDRPSKHKHYLIGSLYCGHCGGRLGLSASRGRHGGIYKYFFCIAGNKKRTDCPQSYIPIETIEEAVAGYYRHIEMSEKDLEQIASQMRSHVAVTRNLAEKEVVRQTIRIERLDAERRKLLAAHYADAVPLDLLREEQDRIARESHQAERVLEVCDGQFRLIEANLDRALALLASCAEVYRRSAPEGRRKLNQALFEKIFVVDDMVSAVDLAAPFHELTDSDLAGRISREEDLDLDVLLADEAEPTVRYERQKGSVAAGDSVLATITWHPRERPDGALPVDSKNPAAYCRRRGSNKTLLAEGGGFEPPGP
ncbi:MAG: recombinase family protein [Acidimicrobiales bacterium]